jgi:hypothetical protein
MVTDARCCFAKSDKVRLHNVIGPSVVVLLLWCCMEKLSIVLRNGYVSYGGCCLEA